MKETVEELIKQRRGYKYLSADGVSPYQDYQYDLSNRKQLISDCLDEDGNHSCGSGWNLATLQWIADNCLKLDGVIVECTIPKKVKIVLPINSDGKFRTNIIKIKKVHAIDSLFPKLKNLRERLASYETINPITAVKMPPKANIKKVLAQIRAQVWAQVGTQVWDQVGAQVWDQVRAQVWDQVWIIAYYALKLFFNLPYEHPVFELIRMGIIVVDVAGETKVLGKNGKYLGKL